MSVPADFVHIVAEGLGLKATNDAAKTLAPDIEYRLREIIQEAQKFARHARRARIIPEDINLALRLRNVEPIYGLSSSSDPARFVRAAGFEDIFYAHDPVLAIDAALDTPLAPVPWEAGVRVHWLAVDGVQPLIPENAPLLPVHHREKRRRTEAERPAPQAHVAPPQSGAAASAQPPAGTTTGPAAATAAAAGNFATADEGALVRAPVKHVLSKELHMYYDKAAAVLKAPSPAGTAATTSRPSGAADTVNFDTSPACRALLASLRVDAGLQPLAPYLCQLVAEEVANSLGNAVKLDTLLRAAMAMTLNPNLDLGQYLHTLASAVLTCLLGRNVAAPSRARPPSSAGTANAAFAGPEGAALAADAAQWTVREAAARAVASLCKSYPDAAPRIQRQLVGALAAPGAALQTIFGAIAGINAQGPRTVKALLLPNLLPCIHALKEDLEGRRGPARMAAALRVRGALLATAGHCVYLSGVCSLWNAQQRNGQKNGVGKQQQRKSTKTATRTKSSKSPSPRLAKVTAADVEAGKVSAVSVPGGETRVGRKQASGKKRGGGAGIKRSRSGGEKTAINGAPLALNEIFNDEVTDADVANELEAAAESLERISAASLHPVCPDEGRHRRGEGGLIVPQLPEKNELAEAWREDFPMTDLRRLMVLVFGEDIAPYEREETGTPGQGGGLNAAAFI